MIKNLCLEDHCSYFNMRNSELAKSSFKKVPIIILLLTLALHTVSLTYAQQEKLVVLMPTPSKYADPYVSSFQEWYLNKTGKMISVEHVQLGGVKIVPRVEEQGGKPREDVVVSLGFDEFERLKKGGFIEPYFSPNRGSIPERIGNLVGRDSEGYYSGFSLAAYGIMVNKEVLQNQSLTIPLGYKDLALNKDYYGRIVMGSPISTSIAHGNLEVILSHYGWVQGWNISIHMASLIDRFLTSTDTATVLTAEGEYAAVLTKNSYWNEYVRTGYPVEWIWPHEGTNAYILYTGILKGAENRGNAELWIDWMLSREGQLAWVELRHETVLRSDIDPPSEIPTIEELNLEEKINPNYNLTIAKQQYDAITDVSWKLIGYHNIIQQNYLNEEVLNSYLDNWIIAPKRQAEIEISQSRDAIINLESIALTETGYAFLDQAKTTLSEAERAFNTTYNHHMATELASKSYYLAQIAAGYVLPPPIWPYYLAIIIVSLIVVIISWRFRLRIRSEAKLKEYSETLKTMVDQRTNELRESEEYYRTLVETSPDGIIITDLNGNLLRVNKYFAHLLGYDSEEELLSNRKSTLDLVIQEDRQRIIENRKTALEIGGYRNVVYTMVKNDGKTFTAELNVSLILDLEGRPKSLMDVVRDITERKLAEDVLREQNIQLKNLDEMKSQFISTATHELRTPLVSIIGYTELIRSGIGGEVPKKIDELMEVIERNANRLSRLTNDLLDQQRIESGRLEISPESIMLNQIIEEVIQEIKPFISAKDQTLNSTIPDDLPLVYADRIRIAQVLLNLLNNASKFTPVKGNINIKIEETEDMIQVKVSDSGIGISKKDLAKLFKPFPSIQKEDFYGGTGLGLSICKGIVELHGGTIWAESKGKGKGSTFTFTIPMHRKDKQ